MKTSKIVIREKQELVGDTDQLVQSQFYHVRNHTWRLSYGDTFL